MDKQKLVEYRNISKWVKISTPSIYKKVLQLEEKGLISSCLEQEGKMPKKAVYSLTDAGREAFESLMLEISSRPVHIFLDLNAVIVNLESMSGEMQQECLNRIESGINQLKFSLEENLAQKEQSPDIPVTGMAVLRQQYALAQAICAWITNLKKNQTEGGCHALSDLRHTRLL